MKEQSSDPRPRERGSEVSLPRRLQPPSRTTPGLSGRRQDTPRSGRGGLTSWVLTEWGRMFSNSAQLILGDHTQRAGRKDCKTAGRRLPRGPRPDHLWSQSTRNKQEVGRASTFPARRQSERGDGGHAQKPRAEPTRPHRPTPSPATPASAGTPRTLSRTTALLRHKRGD